MITRLLAGQRPDGGFGVGPYSKWTGSHWRLVSLVELGVSPTDRGARAAVEEVLGWIGAPSKPLVIDGRERRHASMEGNALAVCCRMGMARDDRVRHLVDLLLRSQWTDGGWNCDRNPEAHHSSFHESHAPIWGLVEYHRATGDSAALAAAHKASELVLSRRVYLSRTTGEPVHPEWTHIHWPHYWHYDFFHGLRALAALGRLGDPRAADALALLAARRRHDGTWAATGRRYWRPPGRGVGGVEVVDWGDAHQIVTPHSLAMLQ